MLVEDDNNLREIYEARLLAEGYEIVSAKDGEEALATAVKEKPDLIISDVMMPKISGFDMLDILRSTPETKNTKVIMMTALSQAEDKARADKLGADKYLVKSQVTLEDVARVAAEVISGNASPGIDSVAPAAPAPAAPPVDTPAMAPVTAVPIAPTVPDVTTPPAPVVSTVPEPVTTPDPQPVAADPAVVPEAAETATASAEELKKIQDQISSFENLPVAVAPDQAAPADPTLGLSPEDQPSPELAAILNTPPTPVETIGVQASPEAPAASIPEPTAEIVVASPPEAVPEGSGSSKRVIQPLNDLSVPAKDLTDLAAKEDALEAAKNPIPTLPPVNEDAPVADTVISPTTDHNSL